MRFGYNIDLSSIDHNRAIDAMIKSRADVHLLMFGNGGFFWQFGDIQLAKMFLERVPNATFILRMWNRNEGDWKRYPQASEYQANWAWAKGQLGNYANRIVFDDPVNEPQMPSNDNASHPDMAAYVARCVAMVEAASKAGVKLAVGAFAVGTLQESVLATTYKPLWNALKTHKQALSYHAYGAIPFEAGETEDISIVLDARKARAYMKDARWPMTHGGWLLAETYRVIQICEGLGFTPEIYLTESIVDNVFNSQTSHIKEQWRAKYGIEMFQRDPRGVRTWERYLKEFFEAEGLSFEYGIAKLLDHARKNIFYHPAFKGACLFALNAQWDYGYDGRGDGTNKHAGSNYDRPEYKLFRDTLLGIVNTTVYPSTPVPPPPPPPMPDPDIPMLDAKIRSKAIEGTRIRQAPQNGAVLGIIPNTWIDAKIQANYAATAWPKIEALGLSGYAAKEWLDIEIEGMEKLYAVQIGNTVLLVPRDSLEDMLEYQIRLAEYLKSKLDE